MFAAGDGTGTSRPSAVDKAKLNQAVSRAVSYFEQAQADDGSWSASSGPGVTAIVATALLAQRPHGG